MDYALENVESLHSVLVLMKYSLYLTRLSYFFVLYIKTYHFFVLYIKTYHF